ncbi:flagellar basal-body rod protein FlgG [Scopulibacillus darangshiensis]|uniref:Flagellar basal-body rod protein FlgG n=1 Tax=Scopulibacillus darangshiensis TaxID=442528 RepID=A0A4R2NE59_9BACL|nr:flagellar hook-basal body protein [Scopulibacillus darangshiensis]TCP19523.1 flagellar basal-body rod protein FlgG [Scopulibacillus darangshiensis]
MDRSLTTASAAMGQIQTKIDVIANNLSNVNTMGYKSKSAVFTSLLTQQIQNVPVDSDRADRLTPKGIRIGTGSKVGDIQLIMVQGAINQTDRPLDLALTKPNQFFMIGVVDDKGRESTQYTRNGAFYLQKDASNPGQMILVTADGNAVLGSDHQRIQIPAGATGIHINAAGVIESVMPDGSHVAAGPIGLVSISRPQLLESKGGSYFSLPNLQSLGLGLNDVRKLIGLQNAAIQQGALEASNVDVTQELTDLVAAERSYQFNARAISISDQMMGLVNSLR